MSSFLQKGRNTPDRSKLSASQRLQPAWWEGQSFITLKRSSNLRKGPSFTAAGESAEYKQAARMEMAQYLFQWYQEWPGASPPPMAPERMREDELWEAAAEYGIQKPLEPEWTALSNKGREARLSQVRKRLIASQVELRLEAELEEEESADPSLSREAVPSHPEGVLATGYGLYRDFYPCDPARERVSQEVAARYGTVIARFRFTSDLRSPLFVEGSDRSRQGELAMEVSVITGLMSSAVPGNLSFECYSLARGVSEAVTKAQLEGFELAGSWEEACDKAELRFQEELAPSWGEEGKTLCFCIAPPDSLEQRLELKRLL